MTATGSARRSDSTHPARVRRDLGGGQAIPNEVERVADELAAAQRRVREAVAALSPRGYVAGLLAKEQRRLIMAGHFPQYGHELAWSGREIIGHLRDSAHIFADRIRLIQTGTHPDLADFVTDAPTRLSWYRTQPLDALLRNLDRAQQGLHLSVTRVTPDQLSLTGRHVVDGPLSLAELLAFLPAHQRDHAAQLEQLVEAVS